MNVLKKIVAASRVASISKKIIKCSCNSGYQLVNTTKCTGRYHAEITESNQSFK